MTALSQGIKRKLSLLQLADELGNVAKACRIMGFHRDTFYEVRRAFQTGGVAALVESRRGARAPHPNRIAPEIEARVLDYCLHRPTHGAQRVSNELRLAGVEVSPSGVRGVWLRHDLETATSGSCAWNANRARTPSSSSPTNTCGSWSVTAPTSAADTSSRTPRGNC